MAQICGKSSPSGKGGWPYTAASSAASSAFFGFARVIQAPWLRLADLIAPTVSLGHAFGRFGNFMNGDAHGYPLRSQWLPEWLRHFPDWMGVTFPLSSPAGRDFPNQPLHPVMLYELALNLIGFFLLWGIRKRPILADTPGRLLGLYLIYYAAVRSFTSLFRADDLYLGPFRMPHVISMAMVLVGLALLLRRSRRACSLTRGCVAWRSHAAQGR